MWSPGSVLLFLQYSFTQISNQFVGINKSYITNSIVGAKALTENKMNENFQWLAYSWIYPSFGQMIITESGDMIKAV